MWFCANNYGKIARNIPSIKYVEGSREAKWRIIIQVYACYRQKIESVLFLPLFLGSTACSLCDFAFCNMVYTCILHLALVQQWDVRSYVNMLWVSGWFVWWWLELMGQKKLLLSCCLFFARKMVCCACFATKMVCLSSNTLLCLVCKSNEVVKGSLLWQLHLATLVLPLDALDLRVNEAKS